MDSPQSLRLILITDRSLAPLPLVEAVRQALEGGVTAVQLREKDLDSRNLYSLASELRETTSHYGAALIINDRVDIALATVADGVHLGRNSMPISIVRKLLGPGRLIGFSAHNMQEAVGAEEGGADYITLSPIFCTHSKDMPIGPRAISMVKEHLRIPVIALGGIREATAAEALENRADGLAAISAIMAHPDPKVKAHGLKKVVDSWFSKVLASAPGGAVKRD
jgi:thiamine-phosphate pyrophosphorylase